MQSDFIGQGLSLGLDTTAGDLINKELTSGKYNSFLGFSAFVRKSGIVNIKDSIKTFILAGGDVHLYVGVDLHSTSKEGLEELIAESIPTSVVFSDNSIVFHPKLYLFRGNVENIIIVGSSNLTGYGLYSNIESSLCIRYTNEDVEGKKVEQQVLDFFDKIIYGTLEIVKPLDSDLLKTLVNSGKVLTEGELRRITNQVNHSLPPVTCESRKKLKQSFGKRPITKRPNEVHKTAEASVVTLPNEATRQPATIVNETIEMISNSFWMATGKMTGGSSNILDLSKSGTRRESDGTKVSIPGGVRFFGIDPNDESQRVDITLRYNGIEYPGNTILMPEGEKSNGSWRIQLKGVNTEGEKFTAIFKSITPKFKIFLFQRYAPNKYDFHIIEDEQLDRFKDNSEWGQCGNAPNGRVYGVII